MFSGCRNLTSIPINLLPATTLKSSCYQEMFMDCTSLSNFVHFPNITVAYSCCRSMYENCSSLKGNVQDFISTAYDNNNATYCFYNIFKNCSLLKGTFTYPGCGGNYAWYSAF